MLEHGLTLSLLHNDTVSVATFSIFILLDYASIDFKRSLSLFNHEVSSNEHLEKSHQDYETLIELDCIIASIIGVPAYVLKLFSVENGPSVGYHGQCANDMHCVPQTQQNSGPAFYYLLIFNDMVQLWIKILGVLWDCNGVDSLANLWLLIILSLVKGIVEALIDSTIVSIAVVQFLC